jgi:flagellar biosynthesis/type III secretory pathway ATPase
MQKPGAPAIKIRKSKDMDELIDQHQKEIDVYIKKNKIKFKNAEDLTQLVEYYNSL